MEQEQMENKSNKTKIIIVLIIVLLLIGAGIFVFKSGILTKESSTTNNEEQKLKVYYNDNFICFEDDCDGYTKYKYIDINPNNIKIVGTDHTYDIIYAENDVVKIYDYTNDKIYETNLKDEYETYNAVVNRENNEIIGIFVNAKFYSLKANKILYDTGYEELMYSGDKYLSSLVKECDNLGCRYTKINILSTEEEKVLFSEDIRNTQSRYFTLKSENKIQNSTSISKKYFVLYMHPTIKGSIKIYNEELKEILSFDNISYDDDIVVDKEGLIRINLGKVVNIYNSSGELVNKSKEYNKVLLISREYIVYTDGDNIFITTLNGEAKKVCKWDEVYRVFSYISPTITNEDIDGIHIVVKDDSVSIDDIVTNNINSGAKAGITKEEVEEDMKRGNGHPGYKYFFSYKTGEITKEPSIAYKQSN